MHISHRSVGPTHAVSVLSISCNIRSCSVIVSKLSLSAMLALIVTVFICDNAERDAVTQVRRQGELRHSDRVKLK